ncbi:hypothetical protein FSP39_012020 [Pinctada imbricata]|uniref:Fibronectin type-III domain-containing protein n=1 Tax=Pinctada imbricata TaxID=66713 RepID=A0AA88XD74_PINIB|nr:hypothetical protein FSP39_012020 [Pinctada imbricata]
MAQVGTAGQNTQWTSADFANVDNHLQKIQLYAKSLQDIMYQERMKLYPWMPNATATSINLGPAAVPEAIDTRLTKIEFKLGDLLTNYSPCPSRGAVGPPVSPPGPPPPRNVIIQSETLGNSSSIVVSWDPPNIMGPDVPVDKLQYKVYFVPIDEYGQQTAAQVVFSICDASQTSASITDLYPSSFYKIWVGSVLCLSSESNSSAKSMKTPDIIPSEPVNLRVEGTKANAIAIRWNPPAVSGSLTNYTIYVASENGSQFQLSVLPRVTNTIMYDLIEGTRYVVSVSAYSDNGEGPKSSPIEVKTDVYYPDMPRNFRVTYVNTTSVGLAWDPPTPTAQAGIIRFYSINYTDSRYTEFFNFKTPDATVTSAIITGLQPATTYYFRAFAHTGRRAGAGSAVVMQDTDMTAPTAPRQLIAESARLDPPPMARLQWLPPEKTYGRLTNYSIHWGVRNGATRKELILDSTLEWYSDYLDDDTVHEFQLFAGNELGYGPPAVVTFSTPKRDTIVPPNVKVERRRNETTSKTELDVTWGPVNRPISGFRILYRKFEWVYTGRWDLKEINDPNARKATIPVQDANYSFIVVVRAYRKGKPKPLQGRRPPW